MLDAWDIAEKVRYGRQKLGKTQEQLAQACGTTRKVVSQIENGKADTVAFRTVIDVLRTAGYQAEMTYGVPARRTPITNDDAQRYLDYYRANYGIGVEI